MKKQVYIHGYDVQKREVELVQYAGDFKLFDVVRDMKERFNFAYFRISIQKENSHLQYITSFCPMSYI